MIPRQFIITTSVLFLVATMMAVYVWQMRQREASKLLPVMQTAHVNPPTPGPTEKVTVWVAYDDPGALRAQTVSIPLTSGRQRRAEQLMRALIDIYTSKDSPHRLLPGADIHAVYLVDPGLAVFDLSAAFAESQPSGILAEELSIASMIQTLSTNVPGLTRVKILVDGKERETLAGHADLSGFYDVAQVSELAKQLASF